MKRKTLILVSCLTAVLMARGAAGKETGPQDRQNPPLVLGIPGFRVPGVNITQREHFGDLEKLLEKEGIPFHNIVYDSREYPLTGVADLASETYSIAVTRVGPSIVRTIKLEKERRETKSLPPLKEVILVMYSQGTTVSYDFVRKLYYFRLKWKGFEEKFGAEWTAVTNDPEYRLLMEAIEDYIMISTIQIQREKDFQRDPDLRHFHTKTTKDVEERFTTFLRYLKEPSTKYPHVEKFENVDTPKYPKKYPKLTQWIDTIIVDPEKRQEFKEFLVECGMFEETQGLEFRFFSTAGSLFGSPHANFGYGFLKTLPVIRFFVKGYKQIHDTRLGSFHHAQKIERLVRESKTTHYPLTSMNMLFVVGVNGNKGDDLVDQPSAHLSKHSFTTVTIHKKESDQEEQAVTITRDILPPLWAIPLEVRHFRKPLLWPRGKFLSGAAYMEVGNPAFDYLKAFINRDFDSIQQMAEANETTFSQFMVEFTFDADSDAGDKDAQGEETATPPAAGFDLNLIAAFMKEFDVRIVKKNKALTFHRRIFNSESSTYVWTGSFKRKAAHSFEKTREEVEFAIRVKGYEPVTVSLPVFPGRINFVKVVLR